MKILDLQCGVGGIKCGAGKYCAKPDGALCLTADCSIQSSCLEPKNLKCGGTNTICSDAQVCALPSKKSISICSNMSCFSNKASVCKNLIDLPCGRGGIGGCKKNEYCVMQNHTLCRVGSCVNNASSKCSPLTNVKCGEGGTYCTKHLICAKPDGRICNTLDCYNNSSCLSASSIKK
jgi:hypothetical protein